jgi:two-component system, response regulator
MEKRTVLLVEDNELEQILAIRAIEKTELDLHVAIARDGDEACRLLFESQAPVPSLVLLDLDLPKVSGLQVLERIRGTEETRQVPVVVLSSCGDAEKIKRCYELGANSYVHKELDAEAYDSKMKLVLFYWTAVNHTHQGSIMLV